MDFEILIQVLFNETLTLCLNSPHQQASDSFLSISITFEDINLILFPITLLPIFN